ncbi:MAG: hypothetical protein GY755_03955 [Chloroflexi bacterium]|nr:hypothetical protein [Chloroflexota bacterium]
MCNCSIRWCNWNPIRSKWIFNGNKSMAYQFGSFINLPVVNYYMHSTYLTGNHAHSAMWGVKGNIALAGMLFCMQHSIKKEHWSPKLVSIAFWSFNGGIALMMFLCLFPIGLFHMYVTMDQ